MINKLLFAENDDGTGALKKLNEIVSNYFDNFTKSAVRLSINRPKKEEAEKIKNTQISKTKKILEEIHTALRCLRQFSKADEQ